MFLRIINYILLATLFVCASIIIVVYASGYRIDLINKKVSQTITIDINPVTVGTDIYINDIFEGTGKVVKRGLPPGRYKIDIKKIGYHSWMKEISIAAGRAQKIDDPILFLENPIVEEFPLGGTAESLAKISETDALTSSNGEIYQNDIFVTRFGSEINGLCWYFDKRYLVFTQDGWLKIMNIDGTNITNIFKKNSYGPVVFVNSGKSAIFEDSGKFYRAQIR
jgi:hypothetical protein